MNRLLLTAAVVSSWSSLLLIDSTIKGGAILLLAACVALLLRRDSAATRHLVWQVAIVAVLVVPVFSALLPHWRVLPNWAVISSGSVEQASLALDAESAENTTIEVKDGGEPSLPIQREHSASTIAIPQPAFVATSRHTDVSDLNNEVASPEVAALATAPTTAATSAQGWSRALPIVWLLGFGVLMLRLVAARLMLWSNESRSAVIAVSATSSNSIGSGGDAANQSLIAVFEEAVRQLQIRQYVCLLMQPERSIPIVWGLWKFRLLLPEAAHDWNTEQQKSVLLHELAHIKRRDTLTQLLSQVACAIYWFNPLVWFAAWRLHVERERACDDLVLCNGVTASAYAEHLLNVASRLKSSRWSQASGLAMARRSSLEGRLTAVLSQQRTRHAVTRVIMVASLLLGGAVAVPVAMLRASENRVPADEGDPRSAKVTGDLKENDKGTNDDQDSANGDNVEPKQPPAGNTAAAAPASETPKPNGPAKSATPTAGAKLPADTEKILRWGKPVNGLRAALSRLPSLGEQQQGQVWDFNLVVQNVTDSPIRFIGDETSPDIRRITLRQDNETLFRLISDEPSNVDVLLQPRETVVVRLFPLNEFGRGKSMADNPRFTFYAMINVAKAPEGAWSGQLLTPDVSGAVISGKQQPEQENTSADAAKPKPGEKISGNVEQKLKWGKTVNGLRSAIMIRDLPDDSMEMMLVVQNVSQADIRIDDTTDQNKYTYFERLDGEIQSVMSDRALNAAPWFGNVLLRPRETVAAPVFPPESKASDGRNIADLMSEIAIKTTNYTMSVEVQLDDVPAATWKGKLRTGDSTGIQAAPLSLGLGSKIDAATEQRLRWGEPSNGLRAALAIRNSPNDVETPDLFLAVQNVSEIPIHLRDIVAARGQRLLTLFREDLPQSQTRIDQPTMANVLLRPREVTFLEMAPRIVPDREKRSKGQSLANVLLKIPQEMLIGEMTVATAPAGGWTGELVTGKTDGKAANGDPMPKYKTAQALFKQWTANARLNGKIPGGQIRSLAKVTSNFVEYNPTDERTPALTKLLQRMDASRDWTRQEVVDLLNDVTDVYDKLPSWVADTSRFSLSDVITTGKPLPEDLKHAPWGEAHPSGLRAAWLLHPQAQEYRLNTPLKSRILYHNDGAETVVFRVVSWNQSGSHQALDATGAKVETLSMDWTTIGQKMAVRLAPGEFTEVIGAGIGIGPRIDNEDWRNTRVGTWIHAKAGDEITFTPDTITASGDDGRQKEFEDSVWWRSLITQRLERDAPIPDDEKERQRILDRAVRDLFGTAATSAETKTFLADKSPDAMKSLAERLAERAGTSSIFGQLQSGPTKFRVLPIDPDAKNKPYVAVGPGRYKFDANATLVIVGRGDVMDAKLEFSGEDASEKSYPIKLPDSRGSWAIAWKRDMTTFWIAEKGSLRSVDFSNPKQVLEVPFGPADKLPISKYFLDALRPTDQPE